MKFPRHLYRYASGGMAVTLMCLLSCGGGSGGDGSATTDSAKKLVYSNPSSTGYRLMRSPSSTDSHLVLSLLGPTGTQIRGCVFSLTVDGSKVTWASAGGSDPYIKEGPTLTLGSGVKLLKSSVSGPLLEAAIYQKGSVPAATLGSEAILSMALELKTGASKGAVTLSSPAAQILDATRTTQSITVSVGNLNAE